ncbi:hypothetical protein [Mesorhizobium sp. LNJC394B00]|uniref:hypothetical protein n=1 Tax=unclassified Mesorhizobium TaxID=325217 RepID=UPI0018DB36A6|nr:hypothetical protein [Mesorhizobium sp. LNJC394B00]
MMDSLVVLEIQTACGDMFVGPGQEKCQLEFIELGLVFDIQPVAENGRAWLAQRIMFSGIDHLPILLLAGYLVLDKRPALIPAQAALTAFLQNEAHTLR